MTGHVTIFAAHQHTLYCAYVNMWNTTALYTVTFTQSYYINSHMTGHVTLQPTDTHAGAGLTGEVRGFDEVVAEASLDEHPRHPVTLLRWASGQ